ncbi:MAG: hypothetical protein HY575_09500 [candidate division NC10 bacterium]|nr:hypothetical protein [candidate division NC10 bacterium]MBI4392109.1 hypothetical protein [candidate division NC10 bacterium]
MGEVSGAFAHLIGRAETAGLRRFLAVLDEWAPVEMADPDGWGTPPEKRLILRGSWEAGEQARCPLSWLGYRADARYGSARIGAAVNTFTALWDAEGERAINREGMREALVAELARRLR